MNKPLRYLLRIAGALVALLFVLWFGLIGYALLNKASLLEKARTALEERIGGEVHIGKLDLSFFRHFPSITARLSDVSLRDSAWPRHHHDLLKAADVFVSCNLFKSLLNRRVQIGEIDLEHGQVYFYTDSTGYSNLYMLKDQKPGKKESKPGSPPDIGLIDIRWVMEREDKHKLFDLDIRQLHCRISADNRMLHLDIRNSTIVVSSFTFNTEKGSFIKGKKLSGAFFVDYNTASKIVQFNQLRLAIDGHPFVFTGRFFPSVHPDPFFLKIETENIPFHQASALLTPNIQQKVDVYDIDKPVSIHAQLDAGSAEDNTPQITVKVDLAGGSVLTPAGRFTEVSFKGSFTNEWQRGQKREDENSALRFLNFTGRLQNLPLHADTVTITNLKFPRLNCDLHSQFPLEQLNEVTGSQTLQFTGGVGNMNLRYKGPLSENDTAGTVVNGRIDLDSASLVYLPYSFKLTNGKGRLLFKDQDLFIQQLGIRAGSTPIMVKGMAKNLVALLDRNTEDVGLDLNLTTPHLDLEDLMGLAGKASTSGAARSSKSPFGASFARIDRLLKEGVIHVGIEADDLKFRKFAGAHAKADLLFDDHEIKLNRLTIQQGAGSIDLKARLSRKDAGAGNPISLESHLNQVDLPKLFTAFNDFGQDAVTGRNLKGRLSADIRLDGALTDKARMVPNSLKGSLDFTIADGQLIDFAPMEKIRVAVLKNKDLSEIRFADLKSHLDLDSTTLTFQRMEIRSTAFTLYAEGIYDLRTGPDMSLQVPISNLSKKQSQNPNIPPDSRGNDSKAGVSVRLRARRGDDGKLKVTWDPFKKALKKVKERKNR
ncbi:MAG TPA: AsmA-like C-terminal region-containing protein [Puia sp.]